MERVQGEIVGSEIVTDELYSGYRNPHFDESALTNPNMMIYEMSNSIATQYPGMTAHEYNLLIAAMVCAYNINKVSRFSPEDVQDGIMVAAPIKHIAKMMGYTITGEKDDKNYYGVIREVAPMLRSRTSLMENDDKSGFIAYGPIDTIVYNPNNDGNVYFKFNPQFSKRIVNNKSDFVINSLIAAHMIEDKGGFNSSRLYEVLNSYLYLARKSSNGIYKHYFDFIDLKCKLCLIKTEDDAIKKILQDKIYDKVEMRDRVAYERSLRIEDIDKMRRQILKEYKESFEYQNVNNVGKEEEKRIREKYKSLSSNILCQYNEYGDFKKRILSQTQNALLECYKTNRDLIEFMFDFEPVRYKSKVIGINITIYTIQAYIKLQMEENNYHQMSIFEDATDADLSAYEQAKAVKVDNMPEEEGRKPRAHKAQKKESLEKTMEYFDEYYRSLPAQKKIALTALDIMNICKEGEFEIVKRNYELLLASKSSIKDPVAWLRTAVKNDYAGKSTTAAKKKNGFSDFKQNDYDFSSLESALQENK